jgi:hypothetical protein
MAFPADLSYDPRRPRFPLPGLPGATFAVEVFTTANVHGLDPARTVVTERAVTADGLTWAGGQQRAEGTVQVRTEPLPGGVALTVDARHPERLKALKLVFHDLPSGAGVGWWQATSPPGLAVASRPGAPVLWRYPWPGEDPWPEWETPWAAAGRDGAQVCLSVRDRSLRPVRLHAHRPPWGGGGEVVEVIVEEDARHWDGHLAGPQVRVRRVSDEAGALDDLNEHLDHVERVHGLPRWESRPDVPGWFADVRLVVALHGCHWTGYVFNTYAAMAAALKTITAWIPGRHVLAYLPGWEGRYYFDYPRYEPSDLLGGPDGFAALVDAAHGLGVRVMPMFGVHGANAARFAAWEGLSLRSRADRMPVRVNSPDWDGDRAGEDDQVFCNPGHPAFREHLRAEIGRVVDTYGVDAVHLDTTACWFNDPRASLVDGYRDLVAALRAAHPALLVAGEGWFDALWSVFPVNQSWHGVDRRFRAPEIVTRWGRAVGHLSTGAPGSGSTGVHELGWTTPGDVTDPAPGHLPVLTVVDDTLTAHAGTARRICEAAAQRA